jgi:predicted MPP superfamily phosphohydrolase
LWKHKIYYFSIFFEMEVGFNKFHNYLYIFMIHFFSNINLHSYEINKNTFKFYIWIQRVLELLSCFHVNSNNSIIKKPLSNGKVKLKKFLIYFLELKLKNLHKSMLKKSNTDYFLLLTHKHEIWNNVISHYLMVIILNPNYCLCQ